MGDIGVDGHSDGKRGDVQIRHVELVFDELERLVSLHRRMALGEVELTAGLFGRQDREQELKQAIAEAVAVLEETKRAFKSKRLADLREKLERVLAEAGD